MIVSSLGPGELDEMERMQGISDKTFVFGKTEYKARKVVWIPGEVGGRKAKIRTEVVEREVPWIISRDWMEEWGMVIDVTNMEVELRKQGICMKCTVDGRGHMRLELQQRKKEQEWWESGWIHDQDRWKKGAKKLHLQFGRTRKEKLKR